jgi:hypothetical protein
VWLEATRAGVGAAIAGGGEGSQRLDNAWAEEDHQRALEEERRQQWREEEDWRAHRRFMEEKEV